MSEPPVFAVDVETVLYECLLRHAPRRVLVAFSGGVDSTALLAGCVRVRTAHFPKLEIHAVHINHGLQDEAADWQQHCEQICRDLKVPLQVMPVAVETTGNVEANARAARYHAFAQTVRAGDLLLLGHHQQDQTETVLYRLFQGRGLLPMRAAGETGEGEFARPLLSVAPGRLRDYVRHQGLDWIEDPSNGDVRLVRNFLRHDVLPLLRQHWAGLHEAVNRVVFAQAAQQEALLHELTPLTDEVAWSRVPVGSAAIAWLRAYLLSRGVTAVSDRALQNFCAQAGESETAVLECAAAGILRLYDGKLYFVRDERTIESEFQISPGQTLVLPGGRLTLTLAKPGDAYAFIAADLVQVRFRRGGERLRMAQGGISRPLKQLFNENRVPPWLRGRYPLLFVAGELACVPGIAARTPAPNDTGPLCVARWQPE